MVDNKGISPVSGGYFKANDASANKMSEEKYGQGGEYYAQDEQITEEGRKKHFQDRSAQLRASLNGLALANVGSIRFMKNLERKQKMKKERERNKEIIDDDDEMIFFEEDFGEDLGEEFNEDFEDETKKEELT